MANIDLRVFFYECYETIVFPKIIVRISLPGVLIEKLRKRVVKFVTLILYKLNSLTKQVTIFDVNFN